ncbi:polyprenyl diphosphate synthase [Microlunatus phosphovorus NM-1]|uniref:Polyprenyl diphosphate synthase n=1 Tax=Microlunatus phosphovorus (strain ATCC 700054 / DSM 10555 / JCM 9379 / NBRC 101784 / NCIMB 13414 / VKM Ac-1990 / NM-1) TaxID=1032480 RepID=F5XRV0_MICPN|nr:polyprenyl synthetase family protein [Microlunatus phosphovorus]BAK37163.1 polyprenyl diphosphate synthase [Microlunatus phosphovorus NM-1]
MVDAPAVPVLLDPSRPLGIPFRTRIGERITAFLARRADELIELQPEIEPLLAVTERLLSGGKRMRPAFCLWGYVAAAGLDRATMDGATGAPADPVLDSVLDAAASLELLHASALVHDDVMDGSDTRRGAPAAHRQFEGLHTADDRLGEPEPFGRAGAILLGDLLVMWSVEMLEQAGMPVAVAPAAYSIAQRMRTEVTCGQYLDVTAQSRPFGAELGHALDAANRVVEYKSARYTVYRPAQLGAVIGGGSPTLLDALAAYGSPLGRAFQFRDDLLGVFGDPEVTGKPVGDDLREGKRTVLVAHALAHTDATGRALLTTRLGDPELDDAGVAALQQVIIGSGAREAVEVMIDRAYQEAIAALAEPSISTPGREALTALATAAVRRQA